MRNRLIPYQDIFIVSRKSEILSQLEVVLNEKRDVDKPSYYEIAHTVYIANNSLVTSLN